MKQETGETRDAIIEDDERTIQAILDKHSARTEKYWIVIFAKPSKICVDGKPTLVKHIKEYFIRPVAQVGMIVGEVNPLLGAISWDVNMPQTPFDFDMLKHFGAKASDDLVIETKSIPNAYLTA